MVAVSCSVRFKQIAKCGQKSNGGVIELRESYISEAEMDIAACKRTHETAEYLDENVDIQKLGVD